MSLMPDEEQRQDALRVMRGFVGAVAGYFGDQSYAGQDGGTPYNPPGQFSTVGPHGTMVEGQPQLRTTMIGGVAIPPALLWIAAGVAAVIVIKKLA